MFRNAFVAGTRPTLELVPGAARTSRWQSLRKVRRTIERWQSQAAIQAALGKSGLPTAYQLEQHLGLKNANGDAPRLLERMEKLGEPAITRYLGEPCRKGPTWHHIQTLVCRYPEVLAVVSEPTWRCLDPTLLDLDEFDQVYRGNGFYLAQAQLDASRHVKLSNPYLGDYGYRHYFRPDRLGLLRATLELQLSMNSGDLIAYYLAFQSLLNLAKAANPLPSLGLLQPQLEAFVARSFGCIELIYPPSCTWLCKQLEIARDCYSSAVAHNADDPAWDAWDRYFATFLEVLTTDKRFMLDAERLRADVS
jgi:hypothetical protein